MAAGLNESDERGLSRYLTACDAFGNTTNGSTTTLPNYEERFGMYVHPHWQQNIDQINSASFALICSFGVFITVVCLIGVTGNATVIYIFSRTLDLRTPSNLLIINLAVSDLTFSFICGFPLMTLTSFERRWKWGDAGCKWYGFVAAVCGLNSINSLACISVDRYVAISRPLKMLHGATNIRSIKMIATCWAWSLVWAVPPMLGWSDYVGEGFQLLLTAFVFEVSCSFDYLTQTKANIAYNICLVVFEFFVPVTVIVLSYAGIILSVSRHSADLQVDSLDLAMLNGDVSLQQHQDVQQFEREIKLAKVAAVMVTLFILSWLPYTVVAQLGINGYQHYITPCVSQLPVLLAKSSAVWNPIVYSLAHPRYQAAIAAILPETLKSLFCRKVVLKSGPKGFTSTTTQSGQRKGENQVRHINVTDHSNQINEVGVSTRVYNTNVKKAQSQSTAVSTIQLFTTAL